VLGRLKRVEKLVNMKRVSIVLWLGVFGYFLRRTWLGFDNIGYVLANLAAFACLLAFAWIATAAIAAGFARAVPRLRGGWVPSTIGILQGLLFYVLILLFTKYVGIFAVASARAGVRESESSRTRTAYYSRVTFLFMKPRRGELLQLSAEGAAKVAPTFRHDLPTAMHCQPERGATCVRRLVALPGESVLIEGSRIRINGALLEEPYIRGERMQPVRALTLRSDEYLTARDDRSLAADKVDDTFIIAQAKQVGGRETFVLWPTARFGPPKQKHYNVPESAGTRINLNGPIARRFVYM
jgi:hypothetical protein